MKSDPYQIERWVEIARKNLDEKLGFPGSRHAHASRQRAPWPLRKMEESKLTLDQVSRDRFGVFIGTGIGVSKAWREKPAVSLSKDPLESPLSQSPA
jgi:hypothetical protein